MNAFDKGRSIESLGMEILDPYLSRLCNGRFVITAKGPLSKHLQETLGDVIANSRGLCIAVEIKIEQRKTGNLFLETWSNKVFDEKQNQGWMFKLIADRLWYYFLDTDELYILDFRKLKEWAFGGNGQLYKYPEKEQSKYTQHNKTAGRLVPIADLGKELGIVIKICNPKKELEA